MPHCSLIEKKLIFRRHLFWQITRTALESPKIDICQNWPRRVLGDVTRCLESKFDKKIQMGSVPNCWKEIPVRDAIRWFKCKLKPPKKINWFTSTSMACTWSIPLSWLTAGMTDMISTLCLKLPITAEVKLFCTSVRTTLESMPCILNSSNCAEFKISS